MNIRGIILAGGKSSRFGEDKALVRIDERTLLERTVDLIRSLGLPAAVITGPARDYSFVQCPIHRDEMPGKGPLGGLHTACVRYPGADFLMLTCDMPGVSRDVLKELIESRDDRHRATVFSRSGGRGADCLPFPGIYMSALEALLEARLKEERLSMREFLGSLPDLKVVRPVSGAEERNLFFNLNERKDLREFNQMEKEKL
jgi:molybdopterin-guanine dinucleotide biosynthesis protein A